jgi:hypothetical protein
MPQKSKHPVIEALINTMPVDQEWPEEEQYKWLRMLAFGMQVAYGHNIANYIRDYVKLAGDGLPLDTAELAKAVRVAPPLNPPTKFHIDGSGFVRNTATGMAVNIEDIDSDEIFDMRGDKSNLNTVTWANGETGVDKYRGVITS